MSCRWRKILIRSFYIKIKWIKIRYWSYPTDLKDESYFCPKKNSTIKILVRDLWVKGCYLRHVHTISDGFSWRHEKPPGIVSTSIRYVTLYFWDRRGAASLRHINHAALPIFVYEQNPYPVWFLRLEYSISDSRDGQNCSKNRPIIKPTKMDFYKFNMILPEIGH